MARAKPARLPKAVIGRARAPTVSDRIQRLAIGGTIPLDTNETGIRAAAAIISRNTGRQFTVDVAGKARVLTRRG